MSNLRTNPEPTHVVRLGCHDCKIEHFVRIPCDDGNRLLKELQDWEYKHPRHRIELPAFLNRDIPRGFDDSQFDDAPDQPYWLKMPVNDQFQANFRRPEYAENTNYQTSYVASAALTNTSLNSLASDASLLAGASSAVVDNGATGAPIEQWVTAQIKNGTTPTTAKEIDVYGWTKLDDSTYPDAITGSDATISISTATAVLEALALIFSFASTTTTGSTYPTGWHTLRAMALSGIFGFIPRYWGIWTVHNTVAAFASSGHVVSQKALYIQS